MRFVLAHCKDVEGVIDIFKKYKNVYGDTAFSSKRTCNEIFKAGFRNRMLFGTDFPITHWFESSNNGYEVLEENLSSSYSNTIKKFKKLNRNSYC